MRLRRKRFADNIRVRRQTVAVGDPLGDRQVSNLDANYTPQLGRGAAARGAIRWGNGSHAPTFRGYLDGPYSVSPVGVGGSRLLASPNRGLPATNGPVAAASNQVLALIAKLPTSPRG